ncbi:MAG: hypothetical protein KDB07_13095 [Planctomycetes bacterium]|nr:hypothetical protein [Planctomycetota bacterium]
MLSLALVVASLTAPTQVFAQEAEKPEVVKEDAKPLKDTNSPEYVSYADLMPPKESFQYWVDTITTSDAEFRKILVQEYKGFWEDDDPRIKNAEQYVADLEANGGLRKERIRRLESSFDYRRKLLQDAGDSEGDLVMMTQDERKNYEARLNDNKRKMIDTDLGGERRQKFAARKITAIKEVGKPDLKLGKAMVIIELENAVTKNTDKYVIFMSLYTKGLMWRWHESKLLPFVDEQGRLMTDEGSFDTKPSEEEVKDNESDVRMQALSDEIAAKQAELAKVQEEARQVDEKRADLHRQIRALQEEQSKLNLARSPYGMPRSTWDTVRKAYDSQDWETFLASHTKAVREKAMNDEEAKKRFMDAAKLRTIRSPNAPKVTYDPEDESKATLKLVVSIASVRKTAVSEGDAKRSDIDATKLEKKHLVLKLRKEQGKWLIDSGI